MPAEPRCFAPKLVGADFELGNFVLGREGRHERVRRDGTGDEAARRLLAELPGIPAWRTRQYGLYRGYGGSYKAYNEQDRGRRFLASNGGCAYIDLSHLELCVPEVTSALDFVAAYHAMLRLGQGALARAQQDLEHGESLEVLVNNSDGQSNSYGSHLNFLVTRQLWGDLMSRKPHYLGFLASHQVTSIIYTGQGKVGSENERAPVDFQLAQRADFFETLCAVQTTYDRPIVNSRNEALCGQADDDYARLHHIFTDAGLAHVATYLKIGTHQLVLAMLEAGDVDLELLVDDPVGAVVEISHDPALPAVRQEVALAGGGGASALALQRRMLERALRHGDRTGFPTVPGANAILSCWEDTLDRLETGELAAVSDRLDWAAKRELLDLAGDDASPAERKHLDLVYSSLDPEKGLYWAYEAAGAFVPVVDDAAIERFTREPPDDTRAWTRAMLLRQFGPAGAIDRVDWDRVVVETSDGEGRTRSYDLALDDPCGHTRADNEHLFTSRAAPEAAPTPRRTT